MPLVQTRPNRRLRAKQIENLILNPNASLPSSIPLRSFHTTMASWAPTEAGLHEILQTIRDSTDNNAAVQREITVVCLPFYLPSLRTELISLNLNDRNLTTLRVRQSTSLILSTSLVSSHKRKIVSGRLPAISSRTMPGSSPALLHRSQVMSKLPFYMLSTTPRQ